MSLKFNNTDITQVFFNGNEQLALKFNDTGYFGKRFALIQTSSSGVSFSIKRSSSPNQRAATGNLNTGNTIYYGDVITISVTANTDFTNPVLYVNTGDGKGAVRRTSPYTFTVGNNVLFYGSAAKKTNEWVTVWTGTKSFTETGSFTVPGLEAGGSVQITANADFEEYFLYESENEEESVYPGANYSGSVNRSEIPATVNGNISSVKFSRSGNVINFEFIPGVDYAKGFAVYELPVSVTITEIRRKA